jgi:hypothetical protein
MQNAVIVYLTRQRDLWYFVHSLKLLFKNLNTDNKYPVIVFHDDITPVIISNILVELHNFLGYLPNVKFEKIAFTLPEGISTDPAKYAMEGEHPTLQQFPLGYRHMCRFFGGLIFNHPSMLKYKYYMRVDSDSFMLSKVSQDPFQWMADNGYEYSDYPLGTDSPKEIEWARRGMWESAKEFIAMNSNRISNPPSNWEGELYNTNFEICDMDFFRKTEYQEYFKHIDDTGNIFYRRWGDHVIRWLGIRLFMKPNGVGKMTELNFCYQHGSFAGNPKLATQDSIDVLPEPFKGCYYKCLKGE